MKNFKGILNILLVVAMVASASLTIGAFAEGQFMETARFAAVLTVLLIVAGSFERSNVFNAAITALTRFSDEAENNTFVSKGIKAFTQAYAAASALVLLKGALLQHVCYAQLTGAMTINATVTNLEQFDEVVFHFSTDGTQRIVTFGTNFVSAGTLTIPASKDATVRAIFDGTNLKVVSREIQG